MESKLLKKISIFLKRAFITLTHKRVELSAVAIVKNEGPYIKEWIEYHKLVGVKRFIIYDNESTDNTKEILKPYIKDRTVVYKYTEGTEKQIPVYKEAIKFYRNTTKWLAIIDLDEFIVPVEKETINEVLKDFEGYPGLGVNWIFFDCNGHTNKPEGLVIENYTNSSKLAPFHIKSIVNPRMIKSITNPHFAIYKKKGGTAVNENFMPIEGAIIEYDSTDKIRINHYYSKSKEEYLAKIQRGNADNPKPKVYFEELLNLKNGAKDNLINDKYLKKLKNILGEKDESPCNRC